MCCKYIIVQNKFQTSAIKYPAFQISYYIWGMCMTFIYTTVLYGVYLLFTHTHTHTAWILYVLVVWFLGLLVAALVIIAVTSSGTIIALLLTGM